MSRRFTWAFGAMFMLVVLCKAAQAQALFWGESDVSPPFTEYNIRRANLDGTGAELFLATPAGKLSTYFAPGKIYWTSVTKVYRANRDGSEVEDVIESPQGELIGGILIDELGGNLYWADPLTVYRSNVDGTNTIILVSGTQIREIPMAFAIHRRTAKLYWISNGIDVSGAVQRCNLDGTNVETLFFSFGDGIAIDEENDKVYWTDQDSIHRSNLDGSAPEILVSNVGQYIGDFAVDWSNGKMYWSEIHPTNRIRRANLDGSEMEAVLSNLANPNPIALDLPPTVVPATSQLMILLTAGLLVLVASRTVLRVRRAVRPA